VLIGRVLSPQQGAWGKTTVDFRESAALFSAQSERLQRGAAGSVRCISNSTHNLRRSRDALTNMVLAVLMCVFMCVVVCQVRWEVRFMVLFLVLD
jgi:hypothetical protein